MKLFDTFEVLTKGSKPLSKEDPPLAIMLPGYLSKKNQKDLQRIQNAENWAIDYNEKNKPIPFAFDNIPMDGFRVGDVTTRYSTSNKHFRVIDPRGFELEIDTENMNRIIQTGNIIKGEICGKYVWCKWHRDHLISVEDPEYIKAANPPKAGDLPVLRPGDIVNLSHQEGMTFLGVFYLAKYREKLVINYIPGDHPYTWNQKRVESIEIQIVYDKKPSYVFKFNSDRGSYWSNKLLACRKPKKYDVVGFNAFYEELDTTKIHNFYGIEHYQGVAYKSLDDISTSVDFPREEYWKHLPITSKKIVERLT